eukprot:TRINITY_DN18903_c0_g1_i1.p2 TRINITY_DN18903_c0_g1~~TRINITY_DN18903_c0_g1_i1.p2  ORF type:complete len:295 (+),score=98.69 TRINITY_DN18903_c0_g1_i1:88-972(+)
MAVAAVLRALALSTSIGVTYGVRQMGTVASHNHQKMEKEKIQALDEEEHRDLLTSRGKPYTQSAFLMDGLVNHEYTQQFKVKEDKHWGGLRKEYKVKLEELEDHSGHEVYKKMDVKDLVHLEPAFWTMHRGHTIELKDMDGKKRKLWMQTPHVFNYHWSWRVTEYDDTDKVLFTIQRRKWNDHCKFIWFKCKAVWKIYEGHKGDKSSLIYYGVGKAKDLDEPEFKWYHSKDDYEDKEKWVAKIEHQKHDDGDGEDQFKVKVRPGEDTALILIAVACIDQVADSVRVEEHDDHHD